MMVLIRFGVIPRYCSESKSVMAKGTKKKTVIDKESTLYTISCSQVLIATQSMARGNS